MKNMEMNPMVGGEHSGGREALSRVLEELRRLEEQLANGDTSATSRLQELKQVRARIEADIENN